MERKCVDFHVHHSDPTAISIIDSAKEKGIVGLALAGKLEFSSYIYEYINYGEQVGVTIIPGVEEEGLSPTGDNFDLISLGFDPEKPSVNKIWLDRNRIQKKARLAQLEKNHFESNGFTFDGITEDETLTLENVMSGKSNTIGSSLCDLMAENPLNSKQILEYKLSEFDLWTETEKEYGSKSPYNKNPQKLDGKFLFEYFFRKYRPDFIAKSDPSVKIIDTVHKANGVVLYSPEGKFKLEIWNTLLAEGIDGIMAWHSNRLGQKHTDGSIDIPKEVIINTRKKGLLVLGGSDYTYSKNDYQLATGKGDMFISPKRLDEFMNYIKSKNNGKIPWKK